MSSDRDIVINFMNDIKDRTPILLIGNASIIFKNIYKKRIYSALSDTDMSVINNMNIAKMHNVIVIDDLSYLYTNEDLLKIVENTSLRLILLADKDNVSDTLVSRCNSILKIPYSVSKIPSYESETTCLYNTKSMSQDASIKYIAEHSPALLFDINKAKKTKYKDRVVEILANINTVKED
jgi:hypothetical protein